jgi:hypothetical protein
MPRFNGTGPEGQGPKTGRGMGPCGEGKSRGRLFGRGFGRGFGWRRFFTRSEEQGGLEQEKKDLENELKAVKERLDELKDQK